MVLANDIDLGHFDIRFFCRLSVWIDLVKMKAEITPEILRLMDGRTKSYVPAPLPEGIKYDEEPGRCFDWSIMQAIYNRQYTYVEGIARVWNENKWYMHAWLTDGEHAFDPTWKALDSNGVGRVMPADYIGVPMPTVKVAKFMKVTGYQSVLGNYFRNPKLAEACLPPRVPQNFNLIAGALKDLGFSIAVLADSFTRFSREFNNKEEAHAKDRS